MKQSRKLLSLLLALVLITGLIPTAVLAEENTGAGSGSGISTSENSGISQNQTQGSDSGSTPEGLSGPQNTGTDPEGDGKTGTDTVTPVSITQITFQAAPKVYDGRTDNPAVTLSFPDLDPAPSPADYQLTASYLSPGVTADETPNISLSFSLTEAGKLRYQLASSLQIPASLFGSITPAPLTVKAKDQSLPDGVEEIAQGPDQVTVTPVSGETAAVTAVTLTVKDGKIIPSDAELTVTDGAGNSTLANYEIGYEPGTLVLQTAAVTLAPAVPGTDAEPFRYTGAAQPLLVPGTAQNGTMEYSLKSSPLTLSQDGWGPWTTEIPTAISAGTYRLRYRAAGAPGFRSTEPQELTVTMAPQVITLTATAEKVYDGTRKLPQKQGYDDLAIDTAPLAGKQITITGVSGSTFAGKDVGNDLPVTPGSITLAGDDAPNFEIRLTVTGTIQPRPVTVTLGAEKKYGTADPADPYKITSGSLASGEALDFTLTRDPGEAAGKQYAYHLSPGSNPNYAVQVKEGSLTVHPARAHLTVSLDKTSRRPGQEVVITVVSRNGEEGLMASGWNQPQAPRLLAGGKDLTLTRKNPSAADPHTDYAIWTASYKIPKSAKGSMAFQAAMDDDTGNYLAAEDSVKLEIKSPGSNPQTGDSRNPALYLGIALCSAVALAVVILLTVRKSRTPEEHGKK